MTDYAIIETGSKQLRVEPDKEIQVELLHFDEKPKEVTLDKVLLARVGDQLKIGTPFLDKAKVICDYVGEFRGPKTITYKYRRRKNSRRIRGHRQDYLRLLVKKIVTQ